MHQEFICPHCMCQWSVCVDRRGNNARERERERIEKFQAFSDFTVIYKMLGKSTQDVVFTGFFFISDTISFSLKKKKSHR